MEDTITVRVLFFGATADAAGRRLIELTAPAGANSRQIYDLVMQRYPKLASHRLHVAVNQEYVSGDTPIRAGDEVAIFTAVSGG
jgi:molybdopterin converting factor small subunit